MVALSEVAVDIVASGDEARFRDLMESHHYLGALPGNGYNEHARPKLVFLHPLSRTARARLRAAHLDPRLQHGAPKMMLTAARMGSLPAFFQNIDDPRCRQGRRHALPTVLALAAAATLCGMRGYKAISEWVENLGGEKKKRGFSRRGRGPPNYFINSREFVAPEQGIAFR